MDIFEELGIKLPETRQPSSSSLGCIKVGSILVAVPAVDKRVIAQSFHLCLGLEHIDYAGERFVCSLRQTAGRS